MNIFLSVFLFLAIFMIVSMMRRYLVLLIFLELMIFVAFVFYIDLCIYLSSRSHFVYNLIFLVIIIFEGVYGLSLIVALCRREGRDFFIKW